MNPGHHMCALASYYPLCPIFYHPKTNSALILCHHDLNQQYRHLFFVSIFTSNQLI